MAPDFISAPHLHADSTQAVSPFLSTLGASRYERCTAWAFVLVSVLMCLRTALYAGLSRRPKTASLSLAPTAEIAGGVMALLLLARHDILHLRGLFIIACQRLFNGAVVILDVLSFPILVRTLCEIAALRSAVANDDFRGAEAVVRQVVEAFKLELED